MREFLSSVGAVKKSSNETERSIIGETSGRGAAEVSKIDQVYKMAKNKQKLRSLLGKHVDKEEHN